MTSMPLSTANWHWKNKNVSPWARTWFERELTTISIQNEGSEVVSISSVKNVEGDVELGQRKSKLITIYDCKVELEWSGTASDGTVVSGKLIVPEVSHEITLDGLSEYAYTWTLSTPSSPAVDALFALAKTRLPPALEVKFAEFPVALIDTHGKDLQVTSMTATPNGSGAQTPAVGTADATPVAAPSSSATPAPAKAVSKPKSGINTTRVTVDATFMASADDLFSLLTDEKRLPAWTHAPAKSAAKPDTEYSLFGGGVTGRYISLTPAKEIVQTWALQSPTWPQNHSATLTTTLNQADDSTTVTFTLDGVPTGMEDEITRNLQGYYVHGFKSIGYVRLIPSFTPSTPSTSHPAPRQHRQSSATAMRPIIVASAVAIAVLALCAAFLTPYLSLPFPDFLFAAK